MYKHHTKKQKPLILVAWFWSICCCLSSSQPVDPKRVKIGNVVPLYSLSDCFPEGHIIIPNSAGASSSESLRIISQPTCIIYPPQHLNLLIPIICLMLKSRISHQFPVEAHFKNPISTYVHLFFIIGQLTFINFIHVWTYEYRYQKSVHIDYITYMIRYVYMIHILHTVCKRNK